MKILKRHTGFTTNSSGSSDWVDVDVFEEDSWDSPVKESESSTEKSAAGSSDAGEKTSQDQAQTATSEQSTARTESPSRTSPLLDNVVILGGLLLAVVGVFALERFVRRIIRQWREKNE